MVREISSRALIAQCRQYGGIRRRILQRTSRGWRTPPHFRPFAASAASPATRAGVRVAGAGLASA